MPTEFCSIPKTTDPRPKGPEILGSSLQHYYVEELGKSEIKCNTLHIPADLSFKKGLSTHCARQNLDRTLDLAKVQKLFSLLNFSSESCTS